MSDLASLLQYAPYAAGNMIASNNVTEDQLNQQRIQELKQIILAKQQEYDQNQQMNPLLVAQQQNKNAYDQQVKLPTGLADLTATNLKNQETQATQQSRIDLTNQTNTSKMAKDMQDRVIRIGTAVQSQPAPLRMQALQQGLQDEGINPQSPMAQSMISKLKTVDPTQWGTYFNNLTKTLGQYSAQQDTQYLGQTDSATIRGEAEKASAQTHAGATIKAAEIAANARVLAAQARKAGSDDFEQQYRMGKVPPDRAAIGFSFLAQQRVNEAKVSDDPAEQQSLIQDAKRYATLAAQAEKLTYNKASASNTGKPGYEDGKITQTAAPESVLSPELKALIGAGEAQKAAPAPKQGTTSSGAKYTIVPSN